MMALRHFTITTADGVVHKCCQDEAPLNCLGITSKAVIMKRDDDDDEPDDVEILHTLDDEMRTAFTQGRLPISASGPVSQRLLALVHFVGREVPHLTSSQAFAEAWSRLSESEHAAFIEEEKQALTDRLDAKRAEEDAARARSLEEVGKVTDMMEAFENVAKTAEATAIAGRPMKKAAVVETIAKLGDAIRRPGESKEQAFTRALTEDERGRALAKALPYTIGPDHTPAVEKREAPAPLTGAAAEMKKLADAWRGANPGKSEAQAFAAVYTARENVDLKKRYDEQALAKRAAFAA